MIQQLTGQTLRGGATFIGVMTAGVAGISYVKSNILPFEDAILFISCNKFDLFCDPAQIGFVYYEVGFDDRMSGGLDGGNLYPKLAAPADPILSFNLVFPDQVLKSNTNMRLRAQPGSGQPVRAIVSKGECVRVHSRAQEVKPKKAKSGGWLRVQKVSC